MKDFFHRSLKALFVNFQGRLPFYTVFLNVKTSTFTIDIHTILATEIAPALIDYFKCKLTILLVYDPETTLSERVERESKVKELIVENSLVADVVIIRDADIVKTVVDEFRKVDLIPMGGSTGEFLELLFGRSVSQEITEQAACPVLWVKEYEEREPLWKLLLKSPKKIGV